MTCRLLALVFVICISAQAQTIYVSQSGAGAQNGTSIGNSYPVSWLTTSGNWGNSAGQVAPGTTVMLEGAITQDAGIIIQGDGAAGNPVTIKFDTGATIVSACQSGTGYGIGMDHKDYITIDGGGTNNGAIFCTANGYGLANANATVGVAITTSSNITVQNIAITNLYVPVHDQIGAAVGLGVLVNDSGSGSCQNITIKNVLCHDEYIGVSIGYFATTNITLINSEFYNCNWGLGVGDANSSCKGNGILASNCWFHDWAIWDDLSDQNHHNGTYFFSANNGLLTNVSAIACKYGPGFGVHNTSGAFVSGPVASTILENNVFDASDGTSCGNGFITVGVFFEPVDGYTTKIINNTCYGGGNGIFIDVGNGDADGSPIYDITNNLAYNVITYVALNEASQQTYAVDYGNVYPIVSSSFQYSSSSSAGNVSLSTWQGFGFDSHIVQLNPNLNASYFPLPKSPVIGAGASVSGVTVDFYGVTRPTPPSIGAVEPIASGITVYSNGGSVIAKVKSGNSIAWISGGSSAPVSSCGAVDSTGLQAWWTMDDLTGTDASGNGNSIAYTASPSSVIGKITNGVSFNGSTQWGSSSLTSLNFASGTIMWWQNPSTTYNSGSTREIWGQRSTGNTQPEMSAQVFSDNNWYVGWASSGNDARVSLAASSGNYASGAWNFYAFTWSSLGSGLLLNGVQIGTNSSAPTVSNIGRDFDIGNCAQDSPLSFPGTMDDVKIYNKVVSTSELATIYTDGLAGCPQ